MICYPEFIGKFGSSVPDYRGMFLRGLGAESGTLNVIQNASIGDHRHYIGENNRTIGYVTGNNARGGHRTEYEGVPMGQGRDLIIMKTIDWGWDIYSGLQTDYKIDNPVSETRPVNKAVKYIIKVR